MVIEQKWFIFDPTGFEFPILHGWLTRAHVDECGSSKSEKIFGLTLCHKDRSSAK